MMARKCDRCGKLYEPPKKPRQYIISSSSTTKSHYRRNFDLCDSCYEAFAKWVETPLQPEEIKGGA